MIDLPAGHCGDVLLGIAGRYSQLFPLANSPRVPGGLFSLQSTRQVGCLHVLLITGVPAIGMLVHDQA
jgi:hypothetical protein